MHLIHNTDEEFYRTEKSVQFELIAVQTQQWLPARKKIMLDPIGQRRQSQGEHVF
jgi:hypothetical protein